MDITTHFSTYSVVHRLEVYLYRACLYLIGRRVSRHVFGKDGKRAA